MPKEGGSPPSEEFLELEVLKGRLGGSIFSRNLYLYPTLSSTNTRAKEMAAEAAPEGTLVIAEEQTAGRGRMGRRWLSPPGANLLFSLLLRPPLKADRVFSLTMLFALSAIEALESCASVRAGIKWPNDLYVKQKKLGGILTEFSVSSGALVEYVVLGLGLNVNWNPEADQEMLYPATSVLKERGSGVSRLELLVSTLTSFEESYGKLLEHGPDRFLGRWNERCLILDKWVDVDSPGGRVSGKAVGIGRDGALILLGPDGKEKTVRCGDVSMREIPK
jgi:BirA family transcriptional regulator, biotin operon repressor / biotin---[acetyl-CoA-carboxylase] ligase